MSHSASRASPRAFFLFSSSPCQFEIKMDTATVTWCAAFALCCWEALDQAMAETI